MLIALFTFVGVFTLISVVTFVNNLVLKNIISFGNTFSAMSIAFLVATVPGFGICIVGVYRWNEQRDIKQLFSNPIWTKWDFANGSIWFGAQGVYDQRHGYSPLLGLITVNYQTSSKNGPEIVFYGRFGSSGRTVPTYVSFPVLHGHEAEAYTLIERYRTHYRLLLPS